MAHNTKHERNAVVLDLARQGISLRDIAVRLGMSRGRVGHILNRQTAAKAQARYADLTPAERREQALQAARKALAREVALGKKEIEAGLAAQRGKQAA